MNPTLESVRSKIIAAVPEIKGGHFFEVGYPDCQYCGEPRIVRERIRHSIIVDEGSGGSIEEASERNIDTTDFPCSKHFARPIRLADILLAIEDAYQKAIHKEPFRAPFIMEEKNDVMLQIVAQTGTRAWNLRADDLNQQSEECINFLDQIL